MTTGATTTKIKNALAQAQDAYVEAKNELTAAYNAYNRSHSAADKQRILDASVKVTAAALDIRAVRFSGYQNISNKMARTQ